MIFVVTAIAAVLVATLQVTLVPLFAAGAASAELGILAVLVALLAGGPRAAMIMTPAIALAVAFSSDRDPGILMLAYGAVLPIGYGLDRCGIPPGALARLFATAVLSGVWLRVVLSSVAFLDGADFDALVLVRDIVIPGMAFDAALLAILYIPLRLAGRATPRYSLSRRALLP